MAHTLTDTAEDFDVVGAMMDFESGDADAVTTLDLFAHLVKTGAAWSLQGFYGRTATALIEAGYISEDGEVLTYDTED